MKDYYNIYTGEKVNNYFESLGYKYYCDDKKIYLNYNEQNIVFDFKTNTEFEYNDLKFIVCTKDNNTFDILLNIEIDESNSNKLRESFAEGWTYFKSAYRIILNEKKYFKYSNNEIYLEITK